MNKLPSSLSLDAHRQAEIDRINECTQIYWQKAINDPVHARDYLRELCDVIFDGVRIETFLHDIGNILHIKEGILFAPNHPGVLDEHKIFFNNTHSIPYYILHFDFLIEYLLDKKVHFIVSDPIDESYRELIRQMEYIIVPDKAHGKKMTTEEREAINAQIQSYLEKGEHVAFFPEGKSHGEGNIGKLQKGMVHFVNQNPKTPLVPVRLDGFDKPYHQIDVTFAPPKTADDISERNESAEEIVEDIRRRVYRDGLGLRMV